MARIVAVVDSNAVDHLVDDPDLRRVIEGALADDRLRLLYTHLTMDELAEIPDPIRRRDLVAAITSLGEKVPTSAFVLDFSRLDEARLGDDSDDFESLRDGKLSHTVDALIATTARSERGLFITQDRRAAGRAQRAGIE